MTKHWIAAAVDYGDTPDGKARVLGAFKSFDEAKDCVYEDLRRWFDERAELDPEYDLADMRIIAWSANNDRCEWNIEETEVDA